MATRKQALAVAARFGFILDEVNSGVEPLNSFSAIFDHPTHSIGDDHRSITCVSYPPNAAACVWAEAIERMEAEGPWLQPCTDPECDYHHEEVE